MTQTKANHIYNNLFFELAYNDLFFYNKYGDLSHLGFTEEEKDSLTFDLAIAIVTNEIKKRQLKEGMRR